MFDQNSHRFLYGKHVAVFGAGYVGGTVAVLARAAGAHVTVLARDAARMRALGQSGCRVVAADLADHSWHAEIPGADYVLNSVGSGGRGAEGYAHSYLGGAKSLIAWSEGRGSGHLVYTGSTSVYPQGEGAQIDERAEVTASDERSRVLIDTESTLRHWAGPVTLLRLAGIYGPGRHHLWDRLQEGSDTMPGRGTHHLNLIHRDDAVTAILAAWALRTSVSGQVFNVVDDGRFTKAEVVGWLAAKAGLRTPRFTGEQPAGRRANRPDRIILNRRLKDIVGWKPQYPTFREGYAPILEA